MKYSKTLIILTILLSITLFVSGYFFYDTFLDLAVPKVNGAFYQTIEINGLFWNSVQFSFVLALVPISILVTWRLSSITALNKKLATVLIVIISIVIVILVRQETIKYYLEGLTKRSNNEIGRVQVNYPADELNFEYFMFGGLCAGCLLSYFVFRQRKHNKSGLQLR